MKCVFCGRLTLKPALMIGVEAVGPKCAQRAGLKAAVVRLARGAGRVTRPGPTGPKRRMLPQRDALTLDLFEDALEAVQPCV